MPFTKVTTAMTADTPITTPSSVSTDRSLLAHRDSRAIRMASEMVMTLHPDIMQKALQDTMNTGEAATVYSADRTPASVTLRGPFQLARHAQARVRTMILLRLCSNIARSNGMAINAVRVSLRTLGWCMVIVM